MNSKLIGTLCLSLICKSLFAGYSFKLLELEVGNTTYYTYFDNDIRSANNCSDCSIADHFKLHLEDKLERARDVKNEIRLYSCLEIVYTENLNLPHKKDQLYVVTGDLIMSVSEVLDQFTFIRSYEIGNGDEIYTNDLCSSDNHWIYENKLVRMFDVHHGICGMSFFGVQDDLGELEKMTLKKRIEDELRVNGQRKLQELLAELNKNRVIMIGGCSC